MSEPMNRREFLQAAGAGLVLTVSGPKGGVEMSATTQGTEKRLAAKVALVRTADRAAGVPQVIDLLGINPAAGKDVLLKPNFNTADTFPGSTHNDTLEHLIRKLQAMGAKSITVGDRSGPTDTAGVLEEKGIHALCKKLGAGLINFEELPAGSWVHIEPEQSHWRKGFDVARPVVESPCVVATCCLKTHGFGGVFTMALKLSIGAVHKRNMSELHLSLRSMRKMIAEVNVAYAPKLIVLDGIEAFTDGGPMTGTRKRADVLIAGTDRIAIDAVGLAILKDLGSNKAVGEKKIFEQEQISRAVELGLGVARPQDIELVSSEGAGKEYAGRLRTILDQG